MRDNASLTTASTSLIVPATRWHSTLSISSGPVTRIETLMVSGLPIALLQ
jgi:hypothetical protein